MSEIEDLKQKLKESESVEADLRMSLAAAAAQINKPRIPVKSVILVYEDETRKEVNVVTEETRENKPDAVPLEGTGEMIGNPVVDGGRDPKNTDLEAAAAVQEESGLVKADRLQRDTPEEAANPGEDVEHGSVADGSDSAEDDNLNEADSADGSNEPVDEDDEEPAE